MPLLPPPVVAPRILQQIIQILVARDRATGEPKGSAYIWFSRRKDADLASELPVLFFVGIVL